MAIDGIGIQLREIVECGAKANYPADGRGAGFESKRCGMKVGTLEASNADHFAAELPMPEFEQRFAPAVERADAFRTVQLVAGQYIEIAVQRLHVMPTMDYALRTVDYAERALRLGQWQ